MVVCRRLLCFFCEDATLSQRTITALEAQKRHSDRVNVYLDGAYAFGLPAILAAHLHVGQQLTEDAIEALRQADAIERATDRAVRLLARRPHSEAELRRYLARKNTPDAVIEAALAKLQRLGYVDDRAFAAYWVENRERFRPRGIRALRYELRQKGIAADVIEETLQDFDPQASARRAAQTYARRLHNLTRREARNKLAGFLQRRGFAYAVVREVVQDVLDELEAEQPERFVADMHDTDEM